ncbi:hypothetical protein BCR42DRAFT_389590 [Absidia repens]|uniref:Sorting nexin MVP1 n=1 Tax=Absidia repens TaxID=90262 RepID=A0A1X2IRL0_9FUNG|nr:hypothetical protein BCR42DRAFT_389590 [Absidia repens]
MSSFDDDDLDYINSQFSTLALPLEYDRHTEQDPWKYPLTAESILRDIELPAIYNKYYVLLSSQQPQPIVTITALKNFIRSTGTEPLISEKILSLVSHSTSSQMTLSKDQFNLALALLACAQNDLDLPIPILPPIDSATVSSTLTSTIISDTSTSPGISSFRSPRGSTNSTASSVSAILRQNQTVLADQENIENDSDASASDDTVRSQKLSTVNTDKIKKDSVKDYQWFLDMDLITVSLVPQKEGRLFKHVIYLVKSQHGTLIVTRRFNDFYLLWESLLKRYPLRSVPNLPPKKSKRRCGLARFMNSLERHPVLANDDLVKTFLSIQDLQLWWQQNQPSVDDEFIRTMPKMTSLRENIPHDLTDRLKRLQRRMTPAIEQYEKMINIIQRLSSSEQMSANELIRYSVTLNAMDEVEQQMEHQNSCQPCQNVVKGQAKIANSMVTMASLLDDRALSMNNTFLEHLKYHRNLFISFKDMLVRKDQLLDTITDQQHTIPKNIAAKMIIANQNLSSSSSSSPQSPESAYQSYQHHRPLTNEQIDIILQSDHVRDTLHQHRMLFIHSCLASELIYLHQQQAFVSLMYQDMVRQQQKSAKDQHYQWKTLQRDLDTMMPDDPDAFD